MSVLVVAIVLNWNGESDTVSCIESLNAQDHARLEILLVDNASADGSGERLHMRFPAIAYLRTEHNVGYAGGNNCGIEWALERGAEWLLVINNDTVAHPECVRRLVEAASSDRRVAAVAPLIVRYDAPDRVWFAGGHFSIPRAMGVHDHWYEFVEDVLAGLSSRRGTLCECDFLTGCCVLFRADALREVGPFRADFFAYVEDVELSLRLSRSGWKMGWVPGARLRHRVPPPHAEPSPGQIRLRDRNRRRMVRDLYPLLERVQFLVWFWPTRLIHFVRYASRGDLGRARAIIAGMLER